jgi:peptide/nickel transport system ATP-binding protein
VWLKQMSDRMVIMNKGKIEEMGASDAICNGANRSTTAKLINAIPKGRFGEDYHGQV